MNPFKAKHTWESVLVRIVEGLENGTVVLDQQAGPPSEGEGPSGAQSKPSPPVVLSPADPLTLDVIFARSLAVPLQRRGEDVPRKCPFVVAAAWAPLALDGKSGWDFSFR